ERAQLAATIALVKGALPPEALSTQLRASLLTAAHASSASQACSAAEANQRAHAHRSGFALLPRNVVRASIGLAAAALALVALRPLLVHEQENQIELASLDFDDTRFEASESVIEEQELLDTFSESPRDAFERRAGDPFGLEGEGLVLLVDEMMPQVQNLLSPGSSPLGDPEGGLAPNGVGAVWGEGAATAAFSFTGTGGQEGAPFEPGPAIDLFRGFSMGGWGVQPDPEDMDWVFEDRTVAGRVFFEMNQANAPNDSYTWRDIAGQPTAGLKVRTVQPDEDVRLGLLKGLGYGGGGYGESIDLSAQLAVPSRRRPVLRFQEPDQATEQFGRGRQELTELGDDELLSRIPVSRDGEAKDDRVAVTATPDPVDGAAVISARILTDIEPREGEGAGQLFFRYWGDNPWVVVDDSALSTFGADVDTASFGIVRRTLRAGQLPRPEQVRTEELLNWWHPDVPAPTTGDTFAIVMEAGPSRFAPDADVALLRVALRGREVSHVDRKPLALTLVVDVSGSMDEHGRIGLVRDALKLLLRELSATDSIALVTFGTEAHTLVPMTSAANRGAFEDALDLLAPDGGTAVEQGLVAGFELAAAELTPGAVNRVVFLSDGVGNIGETDQERILERVAAERAKGIYLSTIGVGYGVDADEEYADDFLEQIADKGDGLYHNVNDAADAERYLVDQFTRTLEPIARDVKIQLEFDTAQVLEWRQIGYENRALTAAQFRDDAVDAGELHSGHQVNALFEVRLRPGLVAGQALATVRVRWKQPFAIDLGDDSEEGAEDAEVATEIEEIFDAADLSPSFADTSRGYRRAVLIAQLAELLRRSEHATGDAPADMLDEMEALAPFLADVDFDELLGLLRDVRPALQALAEGLGPIDHKINEIRRQQIEIVQQRTRLTDIQEVEARRLQQVEIDRIQGDIKRLEGELQDLLAQELGPREESAR
ncbi:MAG: Ca-activated chloride channel family protein, partial [Planctomycetota bacterium]